MGGSYLRICSENLPGLLLGFHPGTRDLIQDQRHLQELEVKASDVSGY
jgi:hypothetical protein